MTENTKPRPTHTIFKVLGDGPSADWIKVGVAFPHKDGKGLHLKFDGIPVEGHIAVREIKAKTVEPTQQDLPIDTRQAA